MGVYSCVGVTEQSLLRYADSARDAQQLISQTLTQLSGYALLLLTSPRQAAQAEGALAGARQSVVHAAEAVRALQAPEPAAHHYHHMRCAAETLMEACAAATACRGAQERSDKRFDTLTRALRATSDHLRATARLLPGFELIDFGQACCAAHTPRLPGQGIESNSRKSVSGFPSGIASTRRWSGSPFP
ncbi:hypothetical protein MPL3356_150078 [Mesorhizobium plurifarium]|uniref:Uncharacterized protein n=1 Tax=Mesorhizobium plurifarium TaxID=69974 RepID=A0A090DK11_MESPL|nr:hypothetical protein MPL3356_150078 [Mesorhizobium plurifarium]CDX36221.1 hypothetical protein MPLDJ20_20477 [Mesorhizobium plurifarium]